ncbi:MAG TPA: type II toxin-antitoxin system RelE/ParE family toxin [Patescibacteria group bacterium]|nr:type II toxin-antitoxin system RelE/ParE family toxin [Patescibacteria group bacterium]
MPVKNLQIAQSADKSLSKLPRNIQLKLIASFDRIKQNPISCIRLHGELKDYYKFRVGDYRIIYRFSSNESLVKIVKIEHRQGVYR